MIVTGGLKMQKLVFFNSWKNIILGPGDVSSGLGSVSNYTTLDKSQLYQPWSSHPTVEGMMPGWSARMLYSGAFWQVCAFVPWPTLGEQLSCTRLGVGVGTCKVCYLEEFMAKELQTWLKSVHVCEPAALGKGWKQIYQSNDDFQILESTPTTQEGIILALPCLFRNRCLFLVVFFFFLTQNICTIPWNFLPIIATSEVFLFCICFGSLKMPQNYNLLSQDRTFVFVWQEFSHYLCSIIKLLDRK